MAPTQPSVHLCSELLVSLRSCRVFLHEPWGADSQRDGAPEEVLALGTQLPPLPAFPWTRAAAGLRRNEQHLAVQMAVSTWLLTRDRVSALPRSPAHLGTAPRDQVRGPPARLTAGLGAARVLYSLYL